MAKIIRLTESELVRLVKKVINEQTPNTTPKNFQWKITGINLRSDYVEAYLADTGSGFEVFFVKKGGLQPELVPNFIVPKISEISSVVSDSPTAPPLPTGVSEESSSIIKTLLLGTQRSPEGGKSPILYQDSDGIPKVGYLTYTSYDVGVPVGICKNRLKKVPKSGTVLNYGDCWISQNKKLIRTLNLRPERDLPQPKRASNT